ncbi:LCP family protein [Catenuloplanes atrovinosus]|uniref:LCP family protein required for cell wall assembly n=1 Tax=Catenuloplanes atrovinosus TaxID=137266 RepID=A0AAE3YHP9_9ACTN|nr:LCP family protein [Catenuloplanes atrovinosus]MDR7273874.1 LCP family protein required for cell wall assembly [Catenuloplanes atrovinosus]
MRRTSRRNQGWGRRRTPWGRILAGAAATMLVLGGGAVVGGRMLLSAATGTVTRQDLLGDARPQRERVEVEGAKNILLVGLDTRPGEEDQPARSDSIIILHIPEAHDHAYLVSLPRDTLVEIPEYDNGEVSFPGGANKINAAFALGSQGLTGAAALSGGFELLAMTVRDATGITPDAGAIIDFDGFTEVVEELGEVCMYVDGTVTSIHLGTNDRTGERAAPYVVNPDGTIRAKVRGVTPNVYEKGNRCFTPEEALDFVRQRDLLETNDFDYGRQRHQQQFMRAVLKNVLDEETTELPSLLAAVGRTMTVDDGGIPLEDWIFAMRGIRSDALTTLKVNDGEFNSETIDGVGSAEILDDTSVALFDAIAEDEVESFLTSNPTVVNDD